MILGMIAVFFYSAFADDVQKHIIYIGDSHSVGTFGAVMNGEIRSLKNTTYEFVASGGTAPFQWADKGYARKTECGYWEKSGDKISEKRLCQKITTPLLRELIAQAPTDRELTVIIAHGTNYSTVERDFSVHTSVSLLKQIPQGAQCIWIGPPQMTKLDTEKRYSIIVDAIKKSKRDCKLIDSRLFSEYPSGPGLDGIHYGYPGGGEKHGQLAARAWGMGVSDLLF